ncbi:MAG: PEP-CTERM sorting domain-containing protein [Verrucomicrobiota bacterium JB022]|nr:PEP-CTERM sorting domain-containing protein [Verrucomicrobiota bacterium JB022]
MKHLLTFAALSAGILPQSFAALTIELSFDSTDFAMGTTGTFAISGTHTPTGSAQGSGYYTLDLAHGMSAGSASSSGFDLSLQSTSLTGTASYDSTPFTFNGAKFYFMVDEMMTGEQVYLSVNLLSDSSVAGLVGQPLTIDLEGTFEIDSSYGSINLEDLYNSYGDGGVTVGAASPVVPEPSTYAALAGLATLAFAAFRRRKA